MTIRFFSKSETHREFSNFAPFPIDLDGLRWIEAKDAVMELAVRRKFELYGELRELLLGTGDEELAEAAPTDFCWGIGRDGTGQNKLGLLLMRIRAELRDG